MSKLLELEELFNEMIRPLDDARTIVDVMIQTDAVEMVDQFHVQKLINIVDMLLSNTWVGANVFWDAIETAATSERVQTIKD